MATTLRWIATDADGESWIYSDIPYRNVAGEWFPQDNNGFCDDLCGVEPAFFGLEKFPAWEDEPVMITIIH